MSILISCFPLLLFDVSKPDRVMITGRPVTS